MTRICFGPPIQIASVYQTIANDGVKLRPTVVDRFVIFRKSWNNKPCSSNKKIEGKSKNLKPLQNALRLPVSGRGGTAKVYIYQIIQFQ